LAAAVLAAGFSVFAALAQRRPKTGRRHVSWQAGQNPYIVIFRTIRSAVLSILGRRSTIGSIDNKVVSIANRFNEEMQVT
jgi:hypothetical protein